MCARGSPPRVSAHRGVHRGAPLTATGKIIAAPSLDREVAGCDAHGYSIWRRRRLSDYPERGYSRAGCGTPGFVMLRAAGTPARPSAVSDPIEIFEEFAIAACPSGLVLPARRNLDVGQARTAQRSARIARPFE